MRKALFFLLIAAGPSFAGVLGLGVVAGVPATELVMAFRNDCANCAFPTKGGHYVVGPAVELRLPFHLAVEADALYRRMENPSGSIWEFPVLAKIRIPARGPVKPVIGGGVSFQRNPLLFGGQTGPNHTETGAAFAAGAEFKLGPLRFGPSIRYTRWTGDGLVHQDQFEVLLAVGF